MSGRNGSAENLDLALFTFFYNLNYRLTPSLLPWSLAVMTSLSIEETNEFAVSEDLVPSTSPKHSQTVSMDFDGLLSPPLVLQTNAKECGGQLWPAGKALARYLIGHESDTLKGKTMFVSSDVSYVSATSEKKITLIDGSDQP